MKKYNYKNKPILLDNFYVYNLKHENEFMSAKINANPNIDIDLNSLKNVDSIYSSFLNQDIILNRCEDRFGNIIFETEKTSKVYLGSMY